MRARKIVLQTIATAAVLVGAMPSKAVPLLPACDGDRRPGRVSTCVSTGDRGWDDGSRWRLKDTEAPEISGRAAACRTEQVMGIRTRDRLRILMSPGYTITYTGRSDPDGWPFVTMRLADGRDASAQLMSEGIVEARPNRTNRWCDRARK